MRGKMMIFLALLCLMLAVAGYMAYQVQIIAEEQAQLQQEIFTLEKENALLREKVAELREQQTELGSRMQNWLDTWDVGMAEVTAYAPLAPAAKEGMCYEGDPHVAASGAEVVPGITAAASPDVPFGTRVWVQGHGMRVVQDRGGRIGPGCIDLAVESREEAVKIGRCKTIAVFEKYRMEVTKSAKR